MAGGERWDRRRDREEGGRREGVGGRKKTSVMIEHSLLACTQLFSCCPEEYGSHRPREALHPLHCSA